LGGGALGAGDLEEALAHAPTLVAADGGAGAALAAGRVPDAVIGDFDSMSESVRAQIPAKRLFRIAEQVSTDFAKALGRVDAPLVLGAGFLGARLDHQLAALSVLLEYAERPCILLGEREVVFHIPPRFRIDLELDDLISLFPLLPVRGQSQGLRWPIEGLELRPGGRVGTSNRALGPVRIDVETPGLLAMLPRVRLAAVIRAVRQAPRWPAPGL